MQAVKVFNNNAVSVVMPDGREAILVGNGLGFGRRPGDVIDKSRVSKVYYVQNELQTKFLKMLITFTRRGCRPPSPSRRRPKGRASFPAAKAVSLTHLTLPTIPPV